MKKLDSVDKWMTYIFSIIFIALVVSTLQSCECKKEKCGVITKIERYGKHGYVIVKYSDGSLVEEGKRRPQDSDVGENYCYCVEYK